METTELGVTIELGVETPKLELYPVPISGRLDREEKEVVEVVSVDEIEEGKETEDCCRWISSS